MGEHRAGALKKKKGLKTGMESDEDLDALLDEFKNEPDAEPLGETVLKAENSSRQISTKEALKEVGQEDAKVDAKTLANRKKKEAKKKKAIRGEGFFKDEPRAEVAISAGKADTVGGSAQLPSAQPKKGGKKEKTAVVKAARERLEREAELARKKAEFDAAEN